MGEDEDNAGKLASVSATISSTPHPPTPSKKAHLHSVVVSTLTLHIFMFNWRFYFFQLKTLIIHSSISVRAKRKYHLLSVI